MIEWIERDKAMVAIVIIDGDRLMTMQLINDFIIVHSNYKTDNNSIANDHRAVDNNNRID